MLHIIIIGVIYLGSFLKLDEKLTTDLCCCKESVGCVAWFATLAVGSICVLIKKAQYLSPTARKHGFYGHVGTFGGCCQREG